MPAMPPRFPAKRTTPPVTFKSETKGEKAVRLEDEKTSTLPEKPMSNKEVMLVLLATHVQDSFMRVTDEQIATVAGKILRGTRPAKIRELYRARVEKMLASTKKLLVKRKIDSRITSFVTSGGSDANG